jgi:ArsR family metal-binding transcriptional regulator
VNGGRELANEIIKKNEKKTHEAREEARRAEEAAERERRIGNVFEFYLRLLFSRFELTVCLPQLNCHRCPSHITP